MKAANKEYRGYTLNRVGRGILINRADGSLAGMAPSIKKARATIDLAKKLAKRQLYIDLMEKAKAMMDMGLEPTSALREAGHEYGEMEWGTDDLKEFVQWGLNNL